MLRWMKKSPGSLPKISETSTRLSQQVMIIALRVLALGAASAYCARSVGAAPGLPGAVALHQVSAAAAWRSSIAPSRSAIARILR